MNTETTGWVIFTTQSIGYFGLCYVLPFALVLRKGKFWFGVVMSWITAAAFSFVSVWIGQFLHHHVDRGLADYCFEGPQFMGFMFCGWWQGLIICFPAWLIYRRRERAKEHNNEVDGIPHSAPSAP